MHPCPHCQGPNGPKDRTCAYCRKPLGKGFGRRPRPDKFAPTLARDETPASAPVASLPVVPRAAIIGAIAGGTLLGILLAHPHFGRSQGVALPPELANLSVVRQTPVHLASEVTKFRAPRRWRVGRRPPGLPEGKRPYVIAAGPGGRLAFTMDGEQVLEMLPGGSARPIAGNGNDDRPTGDGRAADARFFLIKALAYAPDGTLYIGTLPDRIARLHAGQVKTLSARGLLLGVDDRGNVYYGDESNQAIVRLRGGRQAELVGIVPKGTLAHDPVLMTPALGVSPEGACLVDGPMDTNVFTVVGPDRLEPVGPNYSHVLSAPKQFLPGSDGHLYAVLLSDDLVEMRPDGAHRPIWQPESHAGGRPVAALGADNRIFVMTSDWTVWLLEPEGVEALP